MTMLNRQPAQEGQSDADVRAPKPTAAEAAPAGEEHDGLAAKVTPAAEDSSAMAGSPIAEAVVALQQIMEPAPVPSPALEEGEQALHCMRHTVLEQQQTGVLLLTSCLQSELASVLAPGTARRRPGTAWDSLLTCLTSWLAVQMRH